MNNITTITQGCDFTLRIRAKRVATRGYVNVSFVEIADIHVNLVNLPANKTPIAYTIDAEGRLLLDIDGERLDCNSYGIEIIGYYNNGNWRHQLAPAFQIVRTSTEDNYALNESDERTIDLVIVIGETYLTTKGFNQAMEEHDQDIHAHNDLRSTIASMTSQISSLVTEVANAEDGIGQMHQDMEDSIKSAVPTKVSDLTNDACYQTAQQVQQKVDAAKITSADISIDGGTGTPSGSAGVSGNKLVIALHNIKGEKGDTGEPGATGPQGPQGATSVYDQTTQDFLTTLETTTGDSQTKTMTQKAITDAIDSAKDTMGEMVEIKQWSVISKAGFVDGNVITAGSSSSTQYCWFLTVNAGDKVTITATNATSAGFRVAFTDVIPAIGVTVQGKTDIGGTSVNATIVSPIDGYMVFNHASSVFTDSVVKILRKGNYTELQEKASLKILMDVVDMAGYGLSDVESTQVYSNSIGPSGSLISKASDSYRVWEFPAKEEKLYHIHGRIVGSGTYAGYVFYDDQWMSLSHGEEPNGTLRTFDKVVMSPKGAAYLRVSGNLSIPGKVAELVPSRGSGQKTIYPKMSYDYITQAAGLFSENNQYLKAVSTVRFIKVNGSFTVTLPENRALRLVEYDENFHYLRHTVYNGDNYIQANVETELSIGIGTKYIKIGLGDYTGQAGNISIVRMQLKGSFPDNWDTFNISQHGENRQLVIVWAYLTDPRCCEDDSNNVQDTGEYFVECGLISQAALEAYGQHLWDYGRIYLPSTYDNLGEPTRLIIYCHGAAVNYNGDGGFYEDQDLDPKYWLAEGYAILDVEGNPFNNTDEHIHCPQAMDCYVAAYKWAIEHYNLKRDGVFLGGRSMGGGSTIMLLRKECPIPVIAACPNVPAPQMALGTTAERKTFWAKCCGFDIPSGFTFHSGRSVDDRQVYMDNWDRWIKYIPTLSMITDLPTTAEDKEDFADHIWGTTDEEFISFLMTKRAYAKCPVKIFACYEDASVDPELAPKALYRMLINNGQIAELRLFHDSRYTPYSKGDNAHHYDTQDPALRTTVTTRFGKVLTDIPVVYVEMLRFWRRYEQE